MRHTSLCVLVSIAAGTLAHAATLIDTDFGSAHEPVVMRGDKANERVTGVMADGWYDDSGWCNAWATYTRAEEEGIKYLELNATKKEDGRLQLTFSPLPDVTGESHFRLTMKLRNLSGSAVEFGLRMCGAPYKMYWSATSAFTRSWQEHRYEFTLSRNDQQMGFWFNPHGTGVIHLKSLKLERLTRQDLIDELKAKHPDGGPANVIRNSRLPLGLQSGWALDRDFSDGDDVVIEGDPSVTGPSGAPSMKIHAPDKAIVRAEPFGVVYPVTKHKAVLSARGSGEWKFNVIAENKWLGEKRVKLTGSWQRVEVEFMPRLLAKVYEWRIEGAGTMWIDALQVGPSNKVGSYRPQSECEVSLALPASDASPARVQFGDEPARMQWCVTGKLYDATLRFRVANAYGEKRGLPGMWLGLSSKKMNVRRGTLYFDAFDDRPYGPFRVETWVERDGKRVSPYNELVVYRLRRPRYWGKDAPDSPFGVHMNSSTRRILMAKSCGANWTRLHDAGLPYIGWWNLELQRGKWRFFDKELKRYRKHYVKIFAELGTAPGWASYYSGSGRKDFGYFDKFFQPRDLKDYANYVDTVVKRYKGVIDAWDVWNEPWIHAWWGVAFDEKKGGRAGYITSKEPQKDFVRLCRTANETVKRTTPDAIVAGFNSTMGGAGSDTRISGTEWTRGVLQHGGLDHCDIIEYHHYSGDLPLFPEDIVARGVVQATGPISEKLGRLPKPLWMTEGNGALNRSSSGIYKHTLPYEDNENYTDTANTLTRYVVSLLVNGVSRVFLYSMHCHGSFEPKPLSWTVLVTHEGYLHPSGAAISTAAWLLEDTRFDRRLDLGKNVYAYCFDGPRQVAVIAARPPHAQLEAPIVRGAKTIDLYGNPIAARTPLDVNLVYVYADGSTPRLRDALLAWAKSRAPRRP